MHKTIAITIVLTFGLLAVAELDISGQTANIETDQKVNVGTIKEIFRGKNNTALTVSDSD